MVSLALGAYEPLEMRTLLTLLPLPQINIVKTANPLSRAAWIRMLHRFRTDA